MAKMELKETIGCTKKFAVEIEQERLDDQMKDTLKQVRREVQLPGFRKGKVPENILLKRFGPSIRQEALKDMIPAVLQELFAEHEVAAINEPDISDLNMEETGPVTFTVAVEETPEIDVSGMDAIKAERVVYEISDEDVEQELERLRRTRATQEDADRPVQEGDILVMNLQKLDSSGVPIVGDRIENHVTMLDGQSTPSPEFDKQVVGMSPGESKTVRFTYDETIDNEELVGETEAYDVEIVRVVENKVPDLDEEFIANFGEFEDVDAFRARLRERMQEQADQSSRQKLQQDIIDEFVKQYPFEVPSSMVERVISGEMDRAQRSQQAQQFDEDDFRTRIRPEAVRSVQSFLIVEAVKEQQNIEATKEEVDEDLAGMAEANGMTAKEFRRRLIQEGGFDDFKSSIERRKAFDWMIEQADVTDTKPPADDAQADGDNE